MQFISVVFWWKFQLFFWNFFLCSYGLTPGARECSFAKILTLRVLGGPTIVSEVETKAEIAFYAYFLNTAGSQGVKISFPTHLSA